MTILLADPQNTDFSTGPVVVWVETILLCQGLVFATRQIEPQVGWLVLLFGWLCVVVVVVVVVVCGAVAAAVWCVV